MTAILAALIDLNGRPHYLHSGWFLISVANVVVSWPARVDPGNGGVPLGSVTTAIAVNR